MVDWKPFLDAIGVAAKNPYSLIAFALVVLAAVVTFLPGKDRLRGLERVLGHPPHQKGLGPAQLERHYSRRMRFILALAIITWIGVITLLALRRQNVIPEPKEPTYMVNVFSTPSGATVACDGEWRGMTPRAVALTRGTHQCTFTLDGYRKVDTLLEVPRPGPLSMVLERQ